MVVGLFDPLTPVIFPKCQLDQDILLEPLIHYQCCRIVGIANAEEHSNVTVEKLILKYV
jgi:hypothetical protein